MSVRQLTALAVLLTTTLVIYIPGLNGPFLFDDAPNIVQPISAWLNGDTIWQEIVFGNSSGLLHRPLSNLTFAANAWSTGLNPIFFKATNLALHLACGLLLFFLLKSVLPRDNTLSPNALASALAITGLWLSHPLHVSTVLYVVQRMAQLSTLFILASLLIYVTGRTAYQNNNPKKGNAFLFLLLPITTVAALFSKETGATIPALCAVIELTFFIPRHGQSRPRQVHAFFLLFLVLPAATALVFLINSPHILSYEGRLFSLEDRLLTQPRVLWDYIWKIFAPRTPALGLYNDDFPISRGLFTPPTTIIAVIALFIAALTATYLRKRAPTVSAGIGIFLVGHAMESSFLPLEMYFEHRNYFPSIGIILAAVAAACLIFKRTELSVQTSKLTILALWAVLSVSTAIRAHTWTSWETLAIQGLKEHPESLRAHLDYAHILHATGRHSEVQPVFDSLEKLKNPSAKHVSWINTISLQCMTTQSADHRAIERLHAIRGARLQLFELLAFENLARYIQKARCANLEPEYLADIIVQIIDSAPQPEGLKALWRGRFVAAQLYAKSGNAEMAVAQAKKSWDSGAADSAVGIYLTALYFETDLKERAKMTLREVERTISSWDVRNQRAANYLRLAIEQDNPAQ